MYVIEVTLANIMMWTRDRLPNKGKALSSGSNCLQITGAILKPRILVSSCLLGQKVRYNGTDKFSDHSLLGKWQDEGRLVPLCPEIAAGFPTPRPPAEIGDSRDGVQVLMGEASILETTGSDVTDIYRHAAYIALQLAEKHGCKFAVLTDGSPSCGSSFIYDGSFSGVTHSGQGSTTALLRQNGILVFSENQLEELALLISE